MSEKPNIVFIFSDQQRADTINSEVTPNLTELARDGADFTNVYTCQPVCDRRERVCKRVCTPPKTAA